MDNSTLNVNLSVKEHVQQLQRKLQTLEAELGSLSAA